MGEIADMILEGFLDEQTGEVIDGTSPGFPRSMSSGGLRSRRDNRATAERLPYSCPGCARRYAQSNDLKQHRVSKQH